MTHSKHIERFLLMTVAIMLFVVPGARAELTLRLSSATYVHQFSHPTTLGNLLYQQSWDGSREGDLKGSYDCSSTLTKINYSGGTTAQGTCLVLKDDEGGAYVWDICDWNGTDPIDCQISSNIDRCQEIEVYGNCQLPPPKSCIPEPRTLVAAACILLPFALNTIWLLRRKKSLQ